MIAALLKRIDHYELLEKLGEGGTGEVYVARDTRDQRTVAIKILNPHKDAGDAARFQREVRLAAALNHPNVVTVHACSPPESRICYLVTELISGGSLRQLAKRKLPAEEVGVLLLPVLQALEAAHRRGIVHRDVKPDNILVDRQPDGVRIKLMDFGVALSVDEPRITTDNSLSGSIAYMAPEQLSGGEITPASDIWSFGITFFELVSGRHPFSSRHLGPLVKEVLSGEPRFDPGLVAGPLAELVHGCLHRSAAQRYRDGRAAAAALRAALAACGLDQPESELDLWGRDPDYSARLPGRLARKRLAQQAAAGPDPGAASRSSVIRWPVVIVAALLGALLTGLLLRSCLLEKLF